MNLFLQTFSEGEAETVAPSADNTTAEGEFEELIKGKYADAFKSRVQGIIDKRFSKMKAMEKSLEELSPLKEHLEARFPHINRDDTPSLVSAYLKKRLGYDGGKIQESGSQLEIKFEHDIFEDGE